MAEFIPDPAACAEECRRIVGYFCFSCGNPLPDYGRAMCPCHFPEWTEPKLTEVDPDIAMLSRDAVSACGGTWDQIGQDTKAIAKQQELEQERVKDGETVFRAMSAATKSQAKKPHEWWLP